MRTPILAFALLLGGLPAWPEEPSVSNSAEPWLFPRNFVRGYLDFELAPPHNEPDLGLCAFDVTAPGQSARCGGYARYVFGGYLEFQPIGRGPFRRLFVFYQPKLFAGDNLPQVSYTASMAGILWEQSLGVGIELPRGFELRAQTHHNRLLGRYGAKPSAVTGRQDGPYGLHSTVGVRWYFGGYGRAGTRQIQ